MAYDYFLKLDGIPGDSTNEKFANQIQVFSFSFGASNPQPAAGAKGKVNLSSLSLQTEVSIASPKLLLACEQGKQLKSGVLTAVSADGTGASAPVLQLSLQPVRVESVSYGGASGGGRPSESISLSYNALTFSFTPVDASGASGSPVQSGWNISKNAPA